MAEDIAGVLQVSAAVAGDVIVGMAHRTAAGSCVQSPVRTSAWVTSAGFAPDGSVRVSADTAVAGPVTVDLPLNDALGAAGDTVRQTTQKLADVVGLQVRDLRYRVRDGGLLTAYALVDSPAPQHSIDDVPHSILTGDGISYDFAAWIPASVIIAYADRILAGLNSPELTVKSYGTEVGRSLRISVFGILRQHCDSGITITADYVFVVGQHGELSLRRTSWAWEMYKIAGWVAEHFYKDEIDSAVIAATDPSQFAAPVSLLFPVPSQDSGLSRIGVMQAVHATLDHGGLHVYGTWLHRADEQPVLYVTPDTVTFHEPPDIACAPTHQPVFTDETVQLTGNQSSTGVPIRLCDIHLEGDSGYSIAATTIPGAGIAPDRRSLTDIDNPLLGDITLRYQGRGGTDGTLVVMSNARGLIQRIPLRAPLPGPASFRVDPPDVLEVRYYNLPETADGGIAVVATPDCGQANLRQQPQTRQNPAGTVTVHNTGTSPLYVCYAGIESHDGVWDTPVPDRQPVDPGDSTDIAVFFYPQAVGVDYYASIDIGFHDGRTYNVRLHGRLDPESQKASGSPGGPKVDQSVIADLLGERLCVGAHGNICDARGYLEGVSAPDVAVGQIRIGPIPPSSEVIMRGPGGDIALIDTSGASVRDVIIDFPGPDGPGTWNPCIAEFPGLGEAGPAKVRLGLTGTVLRPGGFLDTSGVTAVAPDGDRLHLMTGDGIATYAITGEKPTLCGRLALPGPTALAADFRTLIAATGSDLQVWDSTDCSAPRILGRLTLPAPATAVAIDGPYAWILAGDQLHRVDLAGGTPHLGASIATPEPGRLLVADLGTVAIAGDKHLYHLTAAPQSPLSDLVLPGRLTRLSLTGTVATLTGPFGTHTYKLAATPRLLTRYARPLWHAGLHPAAHLLFELNNGRVRPWSATPHHIDRTHFPDAFALRYKPTRPPL